MNPEVWSAFFDELAEIEKVSGIASTIALAMAKKAPQTAGKIQSPVKNWVKKKLQHAAHGITGGSSLKPGEVSAASEAARFIRNPIKTSKTNFKDMGLTERALLGGLTSMDVADAAQQPKGERAKRLGSSAGGLAGWLAFRKSPLLAGVLGTAVAAKAGENVVGTAGRWKDRKKAELVYGQ